MNNKTKKLLIKAIEESSKIAQYCSKSITYGLFSHHPNKRKTNGDEILIKFYRLQAIIELLQKDGVLPHYTKDYIDHIKRDSLNINKK